MHVPTASSCSTIAIAAALLCPGAATAQSFLGEGSVVQGSARITQLPATNTSGARTEVRVDSDQVVINWAANGPVSNGVQLFQDAGTGAFFQNDRGVQEYAVLNRILPGQDGARMAINGFVRSIVGEGSGGTIFFYSPNGIILGSTARIDVGRLGLTTADPWDGEGDWLVNNRVNFRQALSGSSVEVKAGASIIAIHENSYVAAVAPIVRYAGYARVNGQAALVAAEAATITFNPNGLFDIQVTVGSGGEGEKLTSSGSITGPVATDPDHYHRIYMVAVPKNDAVTMALTGGALGFGVASVAKIENNSVVLSAGHNISAGQAEFAAAEAAGTAASISIRPVEVTSALSATANGSIELSALGSDAHYWSDVALRARDLVEVVADGAELRIDGALSASADALGNGRADQAAGGEIRLLAFNEGALRVGKGAELSAVGFGGYGADGVGGTVSVRADTGGAIAIHDDLLIRADGYGGASGNAVAPDGRGGTVELAALGGGTLTARATDISARGEGGNGTQSDGEGVEGPAGNGIGGSVTIRAGGGGALELASLAVDAGGQGGRAEAFADTGDGEGGQVQLSAFGEGSSLLVKGAASLAADGNAGSAGGDCLECSGTGGTGTGGMVRVGATGGGTGNSLTFGGDLSLSASGFGGVGTTGPGGDGAGGTTELLARQGSEILVRGDVTVEADGWGGSNDGGGQGGKGTGGRLAVGGVDGSLLVDGALTARANGRGGAASEGQGGDAISGSASLRAQGSLVRLSGPVAIAASAQGGGGAAGNGGSATLVAGALDLSVTEGTEPGSRGRLLANDVALTSVATASNGGQSIGGGGNRFLVRGGDAKLGDLAFTVTAGEAAANASADLISVSSGRVEADSLAFNTSNPLALFADEALVELGTLTLDAPDFVPAPGEPPASAGLFKAQSAAITSGNNFMTTANLEVANPFELIAPGSITLAGLTGGSSVVLTAGANVTANGDVEAETLDVTAGDTAAFEGAVSGEVVTITSEDVAIGSAASLTAAGELTLLSSNAGGMLIGDGLSGSGYALSDAEFVRLSGDSIQLGSLGASTSPDMRIGSLSVGGDQLGEFGTLAFFTGAEGGGSIRVEGNVAATGFSLDQTVAFFTGLFELDAATGSVGIAGVGGGVSGALEISAERVWVAESAILDKLAADPFYAGREAELNQPAAVQRPEGVLRAADITVFDASQVLVQNTGTVDIPAGVLAADGDIIAPGTSARIGTLATGPIELIINGQIAGEGGNIIGAAVWEAVLGGEEFDASLFTPNSSINGCSLAAATCGEVPDLGPRIDPPRPDLTFEVEPPLVDKLFAEEQTPCDESKAGVLVNECGLKSNQPIEEPVAGSGNPALTGDEGER